MRAVVKMVAQGAKVIRCEIEFYILGSVSFFDTWRKDIALRQVSEIFLLPLSMTEMFLRYNFGT